MKNVISPEQAQSILLEAEEFLLRPVWMTDDGDEYVIEHAEGELARVAHSEEGRSDALLIVTAINKLPELCRTIIDQAKELERLQQEANEKLRQEREWAPFHAAVPPLPEAERKRLLQELEGLMRLDRETPLTAVFSGLPGPTIEAEAVEERPLRAFLTDKK